MRVLTPPSCLNWTFMELKLELYCVVHTCAILVWIEPLWNWNSHMLSISESLPLVWIEPLWNWNYITRQNAKHGIRFELNLYGIEIVRCVQIAKVYIFCLNWTFMELKCVYVWPSLIVGSAFELNLYGIEMSVGRTVCCAHRPFELNLYGIEIWEWTATGHSARQCLNWTFMELK